MKKLAAMHTVEGDRGHCVTQTWRDDTRTGESQSVAAYLLAHIAQHETVLATPTALGQCASGRAHPARRGRITVRNQLNHIPNTADKVLRAAAIVVVTNGTLLVEAVAANFIVFGLHGAPRAEGTANSFMRVRNGTNSIRYCCADSRGGGLTAATAVSRCEAIFALCLRG